MANPNPGGFLRVGPLPLSSPSVHIAMPPTPHVGSFPVGLGGSQLVLGHPVTVRVVNPPGSPGSLIPSVYPQLSPQLGLGGGGGGSGQGIMGLFQQGGALSAGISGAMPTVPILGQHFSAPLSTAQSGLTMGGQPVMQIPASFQGHPGQFAAPSFPFGAPIPAMPQVVPLSGSRVPTALSGLTFAGRPVVQAPESFRGHPGEFATPSFPADPNITPTKHLFPTSSFPLGGEGGAAAVMLGLSQAPGSWFPTAPGAAEDRARASAGRIVSPVILPGDPAGADGGDGGPAAQHFGVLGLVDHAPIQGWVHGGFGEFGGGPVSHVGSAGYVAAGDLTRVEGLGIGTGAQVVGGDTVVGTGAHAMTAVGTAGGPKGIYGEDLTGVGQGGKTGTEGTGWGGRGKTIAQDGSAGAPEQAVDPCVVSLNAALQRGSPHFSVEQNTVIPSTNRSLQVFVPTGAVDEVGLFTKFYTFGNRGDIHHQVYPSAEGRRVSVIQQLRYSGDAYVSFQYIENFSEDVLNWGNSFPHIAIQSGINQHQPWYFLKLSSDITHQVFLSSHNNWGPAHVWIRAIVTWSRLDRIKGYTTRQPGEFNPAVPLPARPWGEYKDFTMPGAIGGGSSLTFAWAGGVGTPDLFVTGDSPVTTRPFLPDLSYKGSDSGQTVLDRVFEIGAGENVHIATMVVGIAYSRIHGRVQDFVMGICDLRVMRCWK